MMLPFLHPSLSPVSPSHPFPSISFFLLSFLFLLLSILLLSFISLIFTSSFYFLNPHLPPPPPSFFTYSSPYLFHPHLPLFSLIFIYLFLFLLLHILLFTLPPSSSSSSSFLLNFHLPPPPSSFTHPAPSSYLLHPLSTPLAPPNATINTQTLLNEFTTLTSAYFLIFLAIFFPFPFLSLSSHPDSRRGEKKKRKKEGKRGGC